MARTNLCTNPRAGVDTTGWIVEASSGLLDFLVVRSTAWGVLPDGSIGADGTSFEVEATQPNDSTSRATGIITPTPVASNGFACEEGEQYTLSSYVQTLDPSVARGYFQRILWYDAGGTFISTTTGGEVADEGADGLRLVNTFTAPAGAARGRPNVRLLTQTPDDVLHFRVTGILVEHASSALSYFDGDFPGVIWNGTPHASTSTLLDPPEVVTGAATDVDHESATLNGTVDANGVATTRAFGYVTDAQFQIDGFDSETVAGVASAGSGDDPVPVSTPISGLDPDTLYHFRLGAWPTAEGPEAVVFGESETFETAAAPDPVAPPWRRPGDEPRLTFAERLYAALSPLAYADEEHGYPLRTLCEALGAMVQPLEDIVADTDSGPGWTAAYDVDRCPARLLPWLAQHVGVQLPAGISEAGARELIRDPSGPWRGTRQTIASAARRRLTGAQRVTVRERDGGAYQLTVITYDVETPDPAGTEQDVRAEKPVGLVLTYRVDPGWSIGELEVAYDGQDISDLEGDFADLGDLESNLPTV